MQREKTNYVIQSVAHALDVLEQFYGELDELGVTELSKRLKLHKNNVFRLLATLESRGYIEQNKATENYRLGIRCLQLGQTYVSQMGLLRQARPILEEVSRQSRENTYVAVMRRAAVVPLDVVESNLPVRIISNVGEALPLHSTAMGKIYLAYESEEGRRHLLGNNLEKFTDKTIADGAALADLVKAAAGGGGKGMRVVREAAELAAALAGAEREATAAFGDGRVFLERLVERPRHIEVQILADEHGHRIHLGERECSLQRRHQKVVEEAPSAVVDARLRKKITDAALIVAKAVNYANAGTVEFLLAPDESFYFLEINPRLQVEHPVTEMVTGIDLVQQQIRVAAGETLAIRQDDVVLRGHAIECRLYAEDPANKFLPQAGEIRAVSPPSGPGVRVDSALWAGGRVTIDYDPMLAKLVTHGADRESARRRMIQALEDFLVVGPPNNLTFLRALMEMREFREAAIDTQLIERVGAAAIGEARHADLAAAIAAYLVTVGSRPAAATGSTAVGLPTPWDTLGPWRPGMGGGA